MRIVLLESLDIEKVATSTQSLFDGEIATFLQTETPVFSGIRP
ncbi:MAG: hypothetical protein WCA35_26040 [Kovacikia sp.]